VNVVLLVDEDLIDETDVDDIEIQLRVFDRAERLAHEFRGQTHAGIY
jgi:hypothetical protein